MGNQPLATLNYLPHRQGNRRRRWIVRGILAAIAAFAAWQAIAHRGYVDHLKLLYSQYQCMHFTLPAGQVVYDDDQASMTRLLSGKGYVTAPLETGDDAVAFVPDCWPPVDPTNIQCGTLNSTDVQGSTTTAITFLHRRRSRSGNVRLVCVEVYPRGTFIANVIKPAGIAPADPITASSAYLRMTTDSGKESLRVWAGQPDPADPSHFTIDYQLGTARGTIDGWLRDNDTASLRPRVGWVFDNGGNPLDQFWCPENYANRVVCCTPTRRIHPAGAANFLAFSPDGEYLAVSAGQHVCLLNATTLSEKATFSPSDAWGIGKVAFSHNSRWLAVSDTHGAIWVWDVRSGKQLSSVTTGYQVLAPVLFSTDDRTIIAALDPPMLWNSATGDWLRSLDFMDETQLTNAVALSGDGRTVMEGTGADILVWNLKSGRATRRKDAAGAIAFSPDTKTFLTLHPRPLGGDPTGAILKDLAAAKPIMTREVCDGNAIVFPDPVAAIAPGSKAFACAAQVADANGGLCYAVCMWDAAKGDVMWELKDLSHYQDPNDAIPIAMTFSPDGKTLAVINNGGWLETWPCDQVTWKH